MTEARKLIIIGGGPAGLTAAVYAARANLTPLVIAGLEPGGQLMRTTEVENFPGFIEGIQGPELMQNMQEQAKRFGAEIIAEPVVSVDFQAQPLKVSTAQQEYQAEAVIIATGAEANWLNLPNEQRLRGKGVSACATCDGFFFKDRTVVVIGGGDSAMEEANFLTKFANHVIVVHRSEVFKASKIMLERAKNNPKISFVTNAVVVDVLGDDSVIGITVKDNASGEERVIEAEGYFIAIGHTPASQLFSQAGIKVDSKGYIIPQEFTSTNIKGVFVAGDVHDHRYRQAVTAAGEGTKAALDAEKYLASLEGQESVSPEEHWGTSK